jgi:ABC-type transport system involved in cytochrome bd biosynthesis fused ATPase/permease subunit
MQDSKEAEKERINRLRERLMYRALNQISGWKENKLVTAINRQQQEDKMERARKREDEEQKKKLRRLKQTIMILSRCAASNVTVFVASRMKFYVGTHIILLVVTRCVIGSIFTCIQNRREYLDLMENCIKK